MIQCQTGINPRDRMRLTMDILLWFLTIVTGLLGIFCFQDLIRSQTTFRNRLKYTLFSVGFLCIGIPAVLGLLFVILGMQDVYLTVFGPMLLVAALAWCLYAIMTVVGSIFDRSKSSSHP